MAKSFTGRKRIRRSFGRIPEVAPMPNLIEVQKSSYDHFLQMGVTAENRAGVGLQEVFRSVFPVRDFSDRARLEFVRYDLEEPKYDVEECQQRGITYAAPLRVTLRLVVWDIDEETKARSIRDIKEQDVYMGDMPLMTKNGTFIINGTERAPPKASRCCRPRRTACRRKRSSAISMRQRRSRASSRARTPRAAGRRLLTRTAIAATS